MIGDSIEAGIEAELGNLRAEFESMMVDTCIVDRKTGETIDDETLEVVPSWSDVYDGKCRVQIPQALDQPSTAGDAPWMVGRYTLQLPIDESADVAIGDRVTITSSRFDAALVDVVMTVQSTFTKTHALARRVVAQEVQPA